MLKLIILVSYIAVATSMFHGLSDTELSVFEMLYVSVTWPLSVAWIVSQNILQVIGLIPR